MKNVSIAKGVIVAGQYGTGKTETLIGLIRTAGAENPKLRIGAFVAESANIALDAGRYGIGGNAAGVSFASVCCPTIADMRQAMDTALKNRSFDLIFLEPPGNMHPPLMAQVTVDKGIELEHIVMLVSQRDFKDDRHRATFHTGLEIANAIGITHKTNQTSSADLSTEMSRVIRSANPNAPILSFDRGGLSYPELQCNAKWSLEKLTGVTGFSLSTSHSDHYDKVLRVFNPELSEDRIIAVLGQIAKTGVVARAKGQIPKYNLQIDLKGTFLEITKPISPLNGNTMGYAVFFGKGSLPLELIEQVSMAPEQRTRQMLENAPKENRFGVFGRLYKESQTKLENTTVNGKVTYTYSPVDDAEKLATEIYKDTTDDSALRMILPLYHGIRLNALKELGKQPQENDKSNAFSGVHISAVLINTSLIGGNGSQADYPRLSDQHQILEIKAKAVPALLKYASNLRAEDIKDFPRFESAVGPYILKAAKTGWDNLAKEKFGMKAFLSKTKAKENMARIHREAGFNSLADQWENWM